MKASSALARTSFYDALKVPWESDFALSFNNDDDWLYMSGQIFPKAFLLFYILILHCPISLSPDNVPLNV